MTAPKPPMPPDGAENLDIDIAWQGSNWPDPAAAEITARRAANAAFAAAKGQTAARARQSGAEISLVLADNAFVRSLNRDWRDRDAATNVLSFPAMADTPGSDPPKPEGPVLLGDVVVAREVLVTEAQAQNKPFHHHLAHLVCHGTLHLLQYDHLTDNDAATMESLETTILAGLGIPDPYAPVKPL